jgi:phosphoribosyl 1,2-cyclic phosphodiesterase/ActR/RegA family two-component response regulator
MNMASTNAKSLHFLFVDDDKNMADTHAAILEKAGYKTTVMTSAKDALSQLAALSPDCIISDLMMPEMDGLDLYQHVRKLKLEKQPAFIIFTSKVFEFDRRRAFEIGVDGYLTKPARVETFVSDILEIINRDMIVQFWGVRGTLPMSGEDTVKYGGNTNCVTLSLGKKHFFIFDAGTGIKKLSTYFLKQKQFPLSAKIFISHPHYDHINGIPFFVPLYMKGNEFEFYGAPYGDLNIEKILSGQMDSVYFPITVKEFAAKVSYHDLNEESFNIDEVKIQSMQLNHPGRCLGYRVEYNKKIFCYITDHELYLENLPYFNQFDVDRLINFIKDADMVIMDSTYTDAEYAMKIGWGHSCVSRVVDVADKAKVKLLCLFHHDPDQLDKDIDYKLREATAILESRHSTTRCIAPNDGLKITI